MMKVEDINTIEDMQRYVEGVLNDFEFGVSDRSETMDAFLNYTVRVLELGKTLELKENKPPLYQVTNKKSNKGRLVQFMNMKGEFQKAILFYDEQYDSKGNCIFNDKALIHLVNDDFSVKKTSEDKDYNVILPLSKLTHLGYIN